MELLDLPRGYRVARLEPDGRGHLYGGGRQVASFPLDTPDWIIERLAQADYRSRQGELGARREMAWMFRIRLA